MNVYSNCESDGDSEPSENAYCIYLHLVEGIGFNSRINNGDVSERLKHHIVLNVSLKGVKFEVEGNAMSSESSTIFNSNCIWECGMADLKKMKTDNRPLKIDCFLRVGPTALSSLRLIGSLLLPLRGVQIVNNISNLTVKLHWHKLSGLAAEWRSNKPEIYLALMIIKKTIVDSGQLESLLLQRKHCPNSAARSTIGGIVSPHNIETPLMLQSQNNIYVQLLEEIGAIQVGNNPDIDCDIFSVALTFKQVKHIRNLLELEQNTVQRASTKELIFHYDFLGSNSSVALEIQPKDWYLINEKVTLTFKSSMLSLRQYFQRIFYIPVNLYYRSIVVASCRFDFSKYLPDDTYFNIQKLWIKNGTVYFDRLYKILNPCANKPSLDFIFSIQLLASNAKRTNSDNYSCNEFVGLYKPDGRFILPSMDIYNMNQQHNELPLTSRNLKSWEAVNVYHKAYSEPAVDTRNENVFPNSDYIEPIGHDCVSDVDAKFLAQLNMQNGDKRINGNEGENGMESTCTKAKLVDADVQTDITPLKVYATVAVNTDTDKEFDQMILSMKVVNELEEWKNQQMDKFLMKVSQKESDFNVEFQSYWEDQQCLLQKTLEGKIAKCEELNAQLEKALLEVNASVAHKRVDGDLVDTIKRDVEKNYAEKLRKLENDMQRLRIDLQERDVVFQEKTKEMIKENVRLENEKYNLRQRIAKLEKQLENVKETCPPSDKLNDIVNDLRKQSERAVTLEKSCKYYKDKWTKASCDLNDLKLTCLKVYEGNMKQNKSNEKYADFNLSIDKILSEEQEGLKQEKNELEQIKGCFLNSSDTSSLSTEEEVFDNV